MAIIIYLTVYDMVGGDIIKSFEWWTPFLIIANFLYTILASVGMGLACGIISSMITKKFRYLN